MEPNSTWSWLWQNFLSDALWWVFAGAVGVMIAVLKKKRSDWLSPVLYGLIGMLLFGMVLYSSAMYARWPRATPLILVAGLISAGVLHFASVLIERKGGVFVTAKPAARDHTECRVTIEALEAELSNLRNQTPLVISKTVAAVSDIIHGSKDQINQYVRVLDYGIGPSGISEAMPYLDFHFRLLNVSIFPLTVDGAMHGALRLNNKPMSGNVKIRSRSADMGYGHEFRLVCRQWLSKEESNYILNDADDSEEISFCDLEVLIRSASNEHAVTPQPLLISRVENKTIGDLRPPKNMTEGIEHAIYTHAGVMFQLLESKRRLVFFVRVFNGLAHEVSIVDKAEGFILLNDKPFHKRSRFSCSPFQPPEVRLASLSFDQDVDDDEFNAIQKTFADGKSVYFTFEAVSVYIEIKGKRQRLALPDGLSCKPGINYAEMQSLSATIEI